MLSFRRRDAISRILVPLAAACAVMAASVPSAGAEPVPPVPTGCTEFPSDGSVPALECQVPSATMGRDVSVIVRPAISAANPKVALFLDGGDSGDVNGWAEKTPALADLSEVDMTLVFPVTDPWTWSQDWDGDADAQFETFLVHELPTYLEGTFAVPGGGRGTTGVIGLSAGAYGALNIASKHPEQYNSVYALSGLYNPQNPIGRFGMDVSSTHLSDRGRTPWLSEETRGRNNPVLNVENLTMPVLVDVATGIVHPDDLDGGNPAAAFFIGGPVETATFILTAELQAQTMRKGMDNFEFHYDIQGVHSWPTWRRAAFEQGKVWTFLERI